MTGTDISQIVAGEVSSLDDPKKLGRVKVKYPHLGGVQSGWCPLVSPMAGSGRGFFCRPEVGDHVLMALEFGDPNRGYVLGSIWSEAQKPPEGDGKTTENNQRFLRSRSGHVIRLDDTRGKERIEIVDKDGARRVVIDSSGKKISIVCDSGDVEVEAGSGNISLKASGNMKVEANTVSLEAKGNLNIKAGGQLAINGQKVDIN